MTYVEERYPVNGRELIGGLIWTRDQSALLSSSIEIIFLATTVTSPSTGLSWAVPDLVEQVNDYTVRAKALYGTGTSFPLTVGRYRVWYRVTDNPEIALVSSPNTFRIV